MEKAIPEERLRGVWEMLSAQFGAVKSIDERRSGELKGFRAVELILAFEKERVVQRVVFDGDGKIAGLAYQPASMAVLAGGEVKPTQSAFRLFEAASSCVLLVSYSPSMLNAKNRLPPLPSTPDPA